MLQEREDGVSWFPSKRNGTQFGDKVNRLVSQAPSISLAQSHAVLVIYAFTCAHVVFPSYAPLTKSKRSEIEVVETR